ncbi:MAG: WD40/YVTN/BNR-like repeat-containing protein [Verrucomicrobiota bacterium]
METSPRWFRLRTIASHWLAILVPQLLRAIAIGLLLFLSRTGIATAGLPEGWRYDGTYPTGANLFAVWAAAPEDVFVGGEGGVILRWDGATWQTMPTPTQYDINAIHGNGPNDVWAVGGYTLHQDIDKHCVILHFDGQQWSEITPPDYMGWTYPLIDVYAVAANDVWAIPDIGTAAVHWNGSQWDFVNIPLSIEGSFHSITGVGPDHIFITGSHGQILHKSGNSWTMERKTESGNFSTNLIQTFWAADIDHAFAGDNYGNLYRRESDGTWTELGFGGGMFGSKPTWALWGQSGSEIYMVSSDGYRFWDGISDAPQEISFNGQIRGQWFNAHGVGDKLFCIGNNGLIHEIQIAPDHSGTASALASGGGNILSALIIEGTCAYGDSWYLVYGSNRWWPQEAPFYIFDGHLFRPFPIPVRPEGMSDEPNITAMLANGPDDILMAWWDFFTSNQGNYRWNGQEWTALTNANGSFLDTFERMWQADNGDVYGISTHRLFHLPAGSTTGTMLYSLPNELLPTVEFTSIWGRSPTEIYIGTGIGTIYRFDGTTLHLENTPADTELAIDFICGRDSDIYALGDEHLAWKRGTSGWTVLPGVDGAGKDPFSGVIATENAVYATQATYTGYIGGGAGLIWKFVGNQATIVAQGLSGAPGNIVQTNDGYFYAVSNSGHVVTNRPLPDGFSMQRIDFNPSEWQPIGDSGVAVMSQEPIPSSPLLAAWQSRLDLSAFPFGLPEDGTWTVGTQQWVLQQDLMRNGSPTLPPVHVRFNYDPELLPDDADPARATLLRNQRRAWQEVPATTNTPSSTIATLEPTGFSSWILGVQEAPIEPPTLTIEPVGANQVRLSWPIATTGFQLESVQSLGSSEWTPVNNPPTALADAWEVILPSNGANTFFRLRRP